MPVYTISDPTGRKYQVTAPEGISKEKILERAKREITPTLPLIYRPESLSKLLQSGDRRPPISGQIPPSTDENIYTGVADPDLGINIDTAIKPERDPTRPDHGFLSSAALGVARGVQRLSSTAADLLPAFGATTIASISESVGAENAAEALREYATGQINEHLETEKHIAANNPAEFQSYKEVEGVGNAVKFGLQVVGEQVPNLLSIIGTGGVGSAIAKKTAEKQAKKLIAKRADEVIDASELKKLRRTKAGEKLIEQVGNKAAKKALYASTFMGSYALNAPEVFNNIRERTGSFAPGTSLLAGAIAASLDSILPYQVSKAISQNPLLRQEVVKKILAKSGAKPSVLRGLAWGTGKAAALEGATEGGQEAISIIAEHIVMDNWDDLFDNEEMDRIVESIVQGSIGGGPFGGIAGGYQSARKKKILKEADEERKSQEDLESQESQDVIRRKEEAIEDIQEELKYATKPEDTERLQVEEARLQAELETLLSPKERLRREEGARPLGAEGETLEDVAEEEGPEGVSAQNAFKIEQKKEEI